MRQYQYSGQKDAESNSFNIRMARIALEGRIAVAVSLECPPYMLATKDRGCARCGT